MRLLLLSLLAILIAAQSPRSAFAEMRVSLPLYYLEPEPERLMEQAFSTPYGQLLVTEFAAVLGESAAAACLQAKGIDKSKLGEIARRIILHNGARMIRTFSSIIDRSIYKTKLAAQKGADAENELARLLKDPDVRTFIELAALVQYAEIINIVVETLDRYVVTTKIKLARYLNPSLTGNITLGNADPSEAAQTKLDAFIEGRKSAALTRYFDLREAAQVALNQSIDTKAFENMRIVDVTPGLDKDLIDACISRR